MIYLRKHKIGTSQHLGSFRIYRALFQPLHNFLCMDFPLGEIPCAYPCSSSQGPCGSSFPGILRYQVGLQALDDFQGLSSDIHFSPRNDAIIHEKFG